MFTRSRIDGTLQFDNWTYAPPSCNMHACEAMKWLDETLSVYTWVHVEQNITTNGECIY